MKINPPFVETGIQFAEHLVNGNFEAAHALLHPNLKGSYSPRSLRDEFREMYSWYEAGEPRSAQFDREFTLTDWPGKKADDLGWVYVSILGDTFVEAVSMIISRAGDDLLIREIDWGRP